MPDATAAPAPCLVSVICRDHTALADFYRRAGGYTEIDAVHSPIFTALRTPTIALGFHAAAAYELLGLTETASRSGQIHLNLDVGARDGVLAALSAFVREGATVLKEPFETYYGAFQAVVADPEGNVVRLTTRQDALAADEIMAAPEHE